MGLFDCNDIIVDPPQSVEKQKVKQKVSDKVSCLLRGEGNPRPETFRRSASLNNSRRLPSIALFTLGAGSSISSPHQRTKTAAGNARERFSRQLEL